MERRRDLAAIIIASALIVVQLGPAAAGARQSLSISVRRITGPTPFADNCGAAGMAIADSEVEPHLAVDPQDPDHLLTAWQQDRYASGGGARSDLVAVSRDGGSTWTSSLVPDISRCTSAGDGYERVTDPSVAIGPDGAAYLGSLSFDPTTEDLVDWPGAEQVSASSDGGRTWTSGPAVVEADTLFLEREAVTADSLRPGHVYLAWERDIVDSVSQQFSDGHMRFARTEDGGTTWTEPITIPPDASGVVEMPRKVVPVNLAGRGTTLVTIYASMPATSRSSPGPVSIRATRSGDFGATWSAPTEIATGPGGLVSDPESIMDVAGGVHGWPAEAVVAPDGTLYVTWTEQALSPPGVLATDIRYARSADAGMTWTKGFVARLPHQAFMATIAVARDGTIGAFWYDFRNDTAGDDALTTDAWFAYSTDRGVTWREAHVAGPFDLRLAPHDRGSHLFLGDYVGMVGVAHGFAIAFPMAPPLAKDGPSDLFFARVTLPRSSRGG